MTTVIDERVVEMRFNNEDFEKNVKESMSTLDQLKKSLNFDSGKSLEQLGAATKGFSLNGISEAVTTVTSKFSALETIGVGALLNIGAKAADLGVKLVKSLTIDQVTAGFEKYADKTSAVQTIMAATAKDFSNQAEQMTYINEQMDKLMWFTDETSYNFLDMVGNIGKFTNNGVKLDEAVTAMQGIAQWAGISGANTQEASRAMYNFSQAMGAGAMKLQDWKSIENANMATMEFKTIAAETAVEMGKLQKVSEGVYETMAGHTFTLAQFSSYLKDQWFTADVMVGSLSKYGDFTNQLYEVAEATDLTATELLRYIDQYKEGNIDLQKISKETGVSVQDLDGYLQKLSDDTNDLGIRSFKASQEAKTFKEAIDSVKDAVSSQWMKTSEFIFGDYLQAKALWTGLANSMWEVFAAEGERRNETLSQWKERNSLIEAFVNVLNLVYKPLMAVREAWHSMFPATAANRAKILDELTIKFKNFTEAIQPSQKTLNGLRYTFQGLFSVFKIAGQLIASVIKAIFPVTKPLGSIVELTLTITGYLGAFVSAISEYADEIGVFSTITEFISALFSEIVDKVKGFVSIFGPGLLSGLVQFLSFILKVVSTAGSAVSSIFKNSNILQTGITKVANALKFLKAAITSLFAPTEKAVTVTKKMAENYSEAAAITAETGTITRDSVEGFKKAISPLEMIAGAFKKVGTVIAAIGAGIIGAFALMGKAIATFFSNIGKLTTKSTAQTKAYASISKSSYGGMAQMLMSVGAKVKEIFSSITKGNIDIEGMFKGIANGIKEFVKNVDAGQIAAIALSVGLLMIVSASVKLAKQVSETATSVTNIAKTISGTIASVGSSVRGTFNSITKAVDKFSKKSMILETIKTMAIAFGVVAASLVALSLVPTDKLLTVSGIMAAFIVTFTILTAVLTKLAKKLNDAKFLANFRSLAKSIILLSTSMVILALSVSILASAKIEGGLPELYGKVGAAIVMLAGVVAAAIALSKFSKQLPKGALLILALAVAMKTLVGALVGLSDIDFENLNQNWPALIALFTGISLLVAASGHAISPASALAILALSVVLKSTLPALKEIVEMAQNLPYERICQAASDNIGGIVLFFAGLITALAFLLALIEEHKAKVKKLNKAKGGANIFSGIGGAFAGIGIGIALVVASIKKIHEIYSEFDEGEVADLAMLFGSLIAIMGLASAAIIIANKFFGSSYDDKGKIFSRMAIMFVGMGASMRIMASAIKAMSTIEDMGKAWQAVGMIALLSVVLAAVVAVAGDVPKAMPAMVALISATVAIGVLIGELAILSILVSGKNAKNIDKAMQIMTAIFIGLNVTMRSLERIQNVKAGPIVAVVGMLLVVGGSLYLLSQLEWPAVAAAGGAMTASFLALAVLIKVIDKMDTIGVKKLLSLLGLVTIMGLIAVPLYFLAQQDWESIAAAGGALGIALLAMTASLAILSKIGSSAGQIAAAASLVLVAGSLVVVAQALNMLNDIDLGDAAAKVASILGIMSGIMLVFGLISMIPAVGQAFALGLVAFSVALIGVAIAFNIIAIAIPPLAAGLQLLTPALKEFATVDFLTLGSGMIELAWGLGALGAAGLVVGLGAIGLALLAGSLELLGLVGPVAAEGMGKLAEVPLVDIALGLAALGAASGAVGLLSPLILAAAAAIGIFAASILLLNASIQAAGSMIQGFSNMLATAGQKIKNTIDNIKKTIKGLMPDIKSAFSGGAASSVIATAARLGAQIGGSKSGGGFVGGLAKVLGWHSPLQIIKDMLADAGAAFSSDTSAQTAAAASGAATGNAYGKNLWSNISGWLSTAGSGISGFFSSLGNGGKVISSVGSDLDSTGAKAEKFGRTAGNTGKTGIGLLDKINDKVTEFKDGVTEGLDLANFLPEELTNIGDAATGAAGGLGDFGDAAEGAGKKGKGAANDLKSLADSLRSGLDLFSKFEAKSDMTSDQLLENMQSNIDGYASWSHRMTVLAKRFQEHDISVDLLEKLKDNGPKQQEAMNAIYNMTDDQLEKLRGLWETGMTLPESQAEIVQSAFTYMGEMSVQGFSNALDEHDAAHAAAHGLGQAALDGLSESLEVHSPSKATERIGNFLIDGLVAGIDSVHGEGMLYFAVKHVSQNIIDLFTENLSPETMGPIGDNLLDALFANVLGGASETNPIISAFTQGLMVLEPVYTALTAFVEAVIARLNEGLRMDGSASPSLLFYDYGKNSIQGYSNGISNNVAYVRFAISILVTAALGTLNSKNLPSKFYEIGKNATMGFANGIADSEAAKKVMRNAEEIAQAAAKKMKEALDEKSPSKVTAQIGRFASEGLAIGIEDAAGNVYKAAQTVAEEGINGFDSMGRLQDVISDELDLNPIITPMLDLSVLRAQMAEVNSMFSSGTLPYGQNGGTFTANPEVASINFTQNNYSPKELSRYDIYRNTKNQISMMKGVMRANA